MNWNTLYQTCVGITLTMIIFTLAVSFVSGLGVFDPVQTGVSQGDNSSDTFSDITNSSYSESDFSGQAGMDAVWLIGGIGGTVIVAAVLAVRSPVFAGIFLFGTVFWASYVNTMIVLNLGNFVPTEFLLIGTVAMMFVFSGAVVGMLSGSG